MFIVELEYIFDIIISNLSILCSSSPEYLLDQLLEQADVETPELNLITQGFELPNTEIDHNWVK